MKTLQASDFKARCLAVLDELSRTGEPVLITKRGKPVAQLVPAPTDMGQRPQDQLRGTVKVRGDIIEPVLPPEAWDAEGGEGLPQAPKHP